MSSLDHHFIILRIILIFQLILCWKQIKPFLNNHLSDSATLHFQNVCCIQLASSKGQLISKCPFGVFKLTKKTNEIFVRISALTSKKK